ncbi:hypothetical protein Tco_0822709 [Tanacetum coccineum]|uniref:Transmembrane protein n=1 Tax=Tanacetum coccineum TaxID=301880 RepID=A0ABQ5AFU4_9ASTR
MLRRTEERSLNNNSFLGEYECSSLALDREEMRDEKKRLDHLKQDQTMLVIKRFSKRKKVFRERKKTGKIRAKRFRDGENEVGIHCKRQLLWGSMGSIKGEGDLLRLYPYRMYALCFIVDLLVFTFLLSRTGHACSVICLCFRRRLMMLASWLGSCRITKSIFFHFVTVTSLSLDIAYCFLGDFTAYALQLL